MKTRFPFVFLFCLSTLFVTFPLFASVGKDCTLWDAARDAIQIRKPFRVSFTQQVYYGNDLSIEESGDLLFVHSRRIRWTYRDPELKVFLLEGDRYRFYEPEASQLTTGRVRSRHKGWIWELLVSNDKSAIRSCDPLNRSMEIEEPGQGVRYTVSLDSDNLIKSVEFLDTGGGRQVFLFREYRSRVEIKPETFQLKIPPGTEIINQEEEP